MKNPKAIPTAAGIAISSNRKELEPSTRPTWDVSNVKKDE